MGRAALKEFPNFLGTIRRLDNILARLDPAPSWTLESILLPEDGADTSEVINQAEISQPICTAIQIAIVDLLAGCKITSSVNVGHSSGEIAAAYAAGLISAPGAILAAYCRGLAVKEHSIHGTMLAVGLGADGLQQYMAEYSPEELCIACENSPNSVSLSGSPEAVGEIKRKLDEDKIFARELRTGRAYHSPHMAPVGAAYEKMLSNALTGLDQGDLSWRQPRSAMISSVTGELLDTESGSLPPAYWSSNLRQRVLFNSAIRVLGLSPDFKDVKTVVEIGPHSALAGPFKQICLANKFDHGYIPSLVRKQNDVDQLLSIAGSLFIANYPVDLEAVNATEEIPSRVRKPGCQRLLVDLPPYQWNYEKRYWAEPRASAEQRTLTHPRHDLLGSRLTGLSSHSCVWQNRVRHHDIPWLKDHTVSCSPCYPCKQPPY
jgi:acyl transferase domain-containing protein